jgi:hypothetical protein
MLGNTLYNFEGYSMLIMLYTMCNI